MLIQFLGLVDIAVGLLLLFRFSNPIALFFVALLIIKGLSSFIPFMPATNYVVHFCAIVDILAALLLVISFGIGGLAFFAFAYYAFKGLWSLAFSVVFY